MGILIPTPLASQGFVRPTMQTQENYYYHYAGKVILRDDRRTVGLTPLAHSRLGEYGLKRVYPEK